MQVMQRKMSWWDGVIHGWGHQVFRVVSLIFSAVSGYAIYWFFSMLGDDPIQRAVTFGTAAGFVALGYFVTRGLAHRMMNKRRVRSYVLIAVLYLLVEVSCNYGHAAARYPDVVWIHHLVGWQYDLFSFLLPLVLSSMPLFNIALAVIDVDLMQEKGLVLPASPARQGVSMPAPMQPRAGQPVASSQAASSNRGYAAQGQQQNGAAAARQAAPKAPDTQYGKAGGFQFPFPRRGGGNGVEAQPTMVMNSNGHAASMLHDPEKFAVVE